MNPKIILAVVLAVIVVAAWAVNAHRNKGFKTVSSEEFSQIIGDTATVQLLDVRTKEEYEEGHIADALLVDFYSYNFEEQATAKRYLCQLTEFGYLEAHGGNKNRTYSKK